MTDPTLSPTGWVRRTITPVKHYSSVRHPHSPRAECDHRLCPRTKNKKRVYDYHYLYPILLCQKKKGQIQPSHLYLALQKKNKKKRVITATTKIPSADLQTPRQPVTMNLVQSCVPNWVLYHGARHAKHEHVSPLPDHTGGTYHPVNSLGVYTIYNTIPTRCRLDKTH